MSLPDPKFVIEGEPEESVEDGGQAIILTLYNTIRNGDEVVFLNPFVRIQSYREGEMEEDHLAINRLRGQRLRVTIELAEKSCQAVFHHGPGHQTTGRCMLRGAHSQHFLRGPRNDYLWHGDEAFSDVFDQSPEEDVEA